jgi:hypothetical protein
MNLQDAPGPHPDERMVDIEALAEQIDADLRAAGKRGRAEREKAYLKNQLRHDGTPVPAIRAEATATYRAHPDLTHDQVVSLVTALWSSFHPLRGCHVPV